MKRKTAFHQSIPQMVHEEASDHEPCVFLGKPKIDPAHQKQIQRRKKRANQPYFPAFDALDVPPLICPFEFDEEEND